ncbi:MAG: sugar phosphate isomerase/epimerase [TACK group archaeon]|nr:sugar phosphate isomerase/epimerase [TACK group archaeon]
MKVALQLYSVRNDCSKDFFGTLKAVSELGYEGVEFAGFYGKSAVEVREQLDKLGLQAAGSHTGFNSLILWAEDRTISFNEALGNKNIIIPGLPQELSATKEDWYHFADFLNQLAVKLRAKGMRIGYHNHWAEFSPLEGERPWDILGKQTKDVILQLDIGHATRSLGSAQDAVAYLDKYPGRSLSVHVKDFSKSKGYNVVPGEGDIDWEKFLSACKRNGTEWLIIEQEEYPYGSPLETARKALQNVKEKLATV